MNCVLNDEDLTMKAREYVPKNTFRKGSPNMTAGSFAFWVNNDLLPNTTRESGAPRKISVEVGRQRLHSMGFQRNALQREFITMAMMAMKDQRSLKHVKVFLRKWCHWDSFTQAIPPAQKWPVFYPKWSFHRTGRTQSFGFMTKQLSMQTMIKRQCGRMTQSKWSSRKADVLASWFQTLLRSGRAIYLALSDSMHSTLASTDPTTSKKSSEALRIWANPKWLLE